MDLKKTYILYGLQLYAFILIQHPKKEQVQTK